MPYESDFMQYVLSSSIPAESVTVFPVGVGHRINLAVDSKIRLAIVNAKQFSNVVSRKIGLLSDEQAAPIELPNAKFCALD